MKGLLFQLAVFFFAALLSPTSSAQAKNNYPELLTYNALMRLSPVKRRGYITDIRQILADYEARTNKKLEIASTSGGGSAITGKAIPRVVEELGRKTWSCAQAGKNLEFNESVGTCVLKERNTTGFCSSGYHYGSVLYEKDGNKTIGGYCIPDDSWNALGSGRRNILASPGGAPNLSDIYDVYGNKKVPQEMVLGSLSQDDQALATEGRLSDERARELINESVPLATLGEREKEKKKEESQTVAGTCKPAFKCSDITSAERRKLRSQLKGDLCIAGGNFSTYKGGKPRAGGCKTMRNWPSDSNKKFSCTGANTAMCNPFLYCVDKSKKPFCFVPNRNFTAQCEKAASAVKCDPARIEALGFRDEWTDLRNKFSLIVSSKCLGKNPSPSELAFQKFFCSECQSIVNRLYGANFKVVGNGCGSAKADTRSHKKPKKKAKGTTPAVH